MVMSMPVHRSIIAIDIERSTSPARTNLIREELRHELYRLLGTAMQMADITDEHLDPLADRGDGVLALVHPADDVPTTRLLNPLVRTLVTLLADRNARLANAERRRRELRLRVAIHAGEVHYDGKGYFGEALDVAFRLLDAPRLKNCLRQAATPLVLVVSDDIYWSIVRHEYESIPGSAFEPLVRVKVAGRKYRGWVHVPVPVPAVAVPKHQAAVHVPVPGAALSAVYRALERRLAETEEPYDVEAGLAKLKEWISTGQTRV
jgi:hypothetical protein